MAKEAAARVVKIKGKPKVFAAKARAFFKALEDERAAEAARKESLGARSMKLGGVTAGVGLLGLLVSPDLGFLVLVLAAGAAGFGWFQKWSASNLRAFPKPAGGLETMLGRFTADWHPEAPLRAVLDIRSPEEVSQPERTTRSPYSGAQKCYYRALNTRFSGVLADGTAIAVEKTTLTKTKSGSAIRHTTQIRGRLRLPATLPAERQGDWGRFGEVHAVTVGDRELVFWGTIEKLEDWPLDLADILAAVADRPAPARPVEPAGPVQKAS